MKRVITITAVAVLAFAALASAQSTAAENRPLADVARAEEARRKSVTKPAKVYTNASLRTDPGSDPAAAAAAAAAATASGTPAPVGPPPDAPADATPPVAAKDQAYWQNRIKLAREQLARSQIFADSLQTRINSLLTDFVNRDDPAQRAKIETDRQAALAELERVRKEIDAQTKAIQAIEDEARRAGVPAGWLRPGA
jgi:hypothetical protein